MFKTPRLLLEAKVGAVWQPIKIHCNYPDVRLFLNALPRLAIHYGGMSCVRVRRLKTHNEIAEAKLACYKYKDQRRKK